MKKKSIALIIGLMTLALAGVMAMQFYFIKESYIQKSQLFDESVKASMLSVASKIEKMEVMNLAKTQQKSNREKYEREQKKLENQLKLQNRIEQLRVQQYAAHQAFKNDEDELKSRYPLVVSIDNSFYETYIKSPKYRNLVRVRINPGRVVEDLFQENTIDIYAVGDPIKLIRAKDDSIRYAAFLNSQLNSWDYTIKSIAPRKDLKIAQNIQELERQLKLEQANNLFDSIAIIGGKQSKMIEDFAAGLELSKLPLRDRVNLGVLKKELTKALTDRDIISNFNLEVHDRNMLVYSQYVFTNDINDKDNAYSTLLFQGDIERSPGKLTLYFPNKRNLIIENMRNLLVPMITLLFVLIGCFAYTLTTIFRQKKISEMKTDFINNMTHEFKTPVATVMIAAESLRDPEINADQKRVTRLANIIYDENVRLGGHIERVLNIAKLDKENLKLEQTPVAIHKLTNTVLESMNLQLQKVNGTFETSLLAKNDIIIGDELHLSNVLFNLVDNAIKYSNHEPFIKISTFNTKSTLVITVADKGIGMSKEHTQRIFEQFYRIPTGNIHNVKGFGLGLSYVHDIIKRLNGTIQVKSEKDKGTQFEITFPIAKK